MLSYKINPKRWPVMETKVHEQNRNWPSEEEEEADSEGCY